MRAEKSQTDTQTHTHWCSTATVGSAFILNVLFLIVFFTQTYSTRNCAPTSSNTIPRVAHCAN